MSNINNLTSKIIKDAEDNKKVIILEAKKEKNNIYKKKQEEASTSEKNIIEKAKIEAISRKERIISGARLEARNEKLKAKQEVISDIFEISIENLCNISEKDFKEFVRLSVLDTDISGEQKIILNSNGKKIIDRSLLSEINKELGSKANIILSEKTGEFKGGFILEKDGIEINNTFEALVNSLRDDLSIHVANVLFS